MNKEEKKFVDEVITQDLMQYVSTILLGRDALDPKNGSIVLVDTGKRTFGITANHVMVHYETESKKDRSYVMQVGRSLIDPIERLIDRSTVLDIVTLDLDGVVTGENSLYGKPVGTTYFRAPVWPPESPVTGERITICGFPSKAKIRDGDKWYYVTSTIGAQQIHGVNEHTFTVQFERNLWYYIGGEIDSEVPQNIGGVSGGPVFLLRNLENANEVFSIALIGISQEHHEDWDILYVSRLDHVDDVGKIHIN